MVVMVIAGTLLAMGLTIFGRTAARAQRTATDQFTAAVEQARTLAITRRKPVILAIAPPAASDRDTTCRYGIFEVDELPAEGDPINARQVVRWNLMPQGVVFFPDDLEGLRNIAGEGKVQLKWKDGDSQALVHALAFSPRGGLAWPTGSDSVTVKIGSGFYRDGQPVAVKDGGHSGLRIGRVVARPWKLY